MSLYCIHLLVRYSYYLQSARLTKSYFSCVIYSVCIIYYVYVCIVQGCFRTLLSLTLKSWLQWRGELDLNFSAPISVINKCKPVTCNFYAWDAWIWISMCVCVHVRVCTCVCLLCVCLWCASDTLVSDRLESKRTIHSACVVCVVLQLQPDAWVLEGTSKWETTVCYHAPVSGKSTLWHVPLHWGGACPSAISMTTTYNKAAIVSTFTQFAFLYYGTSDPNHIE